MRIAAWSAAVLGAAAIASVGAAWHADDAGHAEPSAGTDSVATPRVRRSTRPSVPHSADPSRPGTTAHLLARDPFAAYALGRELFTREFTAAEGVLGAPIARPLLEDGRTPVVPGGRVGSCLACHNSPLRDAGAGPTIEKNGPTGRNTPHLFGAGLVEMIGFEIRLGLLAAGDADRNGFIDVSEAGAVRAVVATSADGAAVAPVALDFGAFGDADGDGRPDLDPVCRTWFVDASGRRLPWARRLDDPGVAGYDFEVQVFGWGHTAASRAPLSSTLRGFSAAAFNVHSGLQAHDPTLNAEPAGPGPSGWSLAGAAMFASGRTPDAGHARAPDGASLDDPDGDGVADELTEGDMDLLETFLLNHPAPAELPSTPRTSRGRETFTRIGCARCHVPDWRLPAEDVAEPDRSRRSPGDRRAFALEAIGDPATGALSGRLRWIASAASASGAPAPRPAVVVRGVFSDFRHHDLGAAFHQVQFDGSVARTFRTPPLWGVGSTAPYGHDGASLDLESVIRRHGGEAAPEAAAFAALSEDDREAVLAFLRSLVLYSVDDLPCDVDGDGRIRGSNDGEAPERFRPRAGS